MSEGMLHSIRVMVKGFSAAVQPLKESESALKSFKAGGLSAQSTINGLKFKPSFDVSGLKAASKQFQTFEKSVAGMQGMRRSKLAASFQPVAVDDGNVKSFYAAAASVAGKINDAMEPKWSEKQKKAIEEAKEHLDSLGAKAALAGTAILAGLGIAAHSAVKFETEMAKVDILLDEGKANIGGLSAEAKKLAIEFGAEPAEAAKAFGYAVKSGFGQAADAATVAGGAMKLAQATFSDSGELTKSLTSILNAYNLKAFETAKISDMLAVASKHSRADIGEFAESLRKVTPLAFNAGVGIDELFAAESALTQVQNPTEAIMSLRGVLGALVDPSKEAKETARALGINFSNAGVQAMGFQKWLADVKEKTKGSEEALSKLFGAGKTFGGVLALTNGQASKYAEILGKIQNSSGATEDALKKVDATSGDAFEKAKAAVSVLWIEIGSQLLPAVSAFAGAVGWLAEGFGAFAAAHPILAKIGVIMTALVGGALLLTGGILTAMGFIMSLSPVAVAAFGAVIGPVLGVYAAVAALIGISYALAENWDSITAGLVAGFRAIGGAIVAVGAFFADIGRAIWGFYVGFWSMVYNAGAGMLDAFWSGIKSGWERFKSSFTGMIGWVRNLLPGSDAKEGPLKTLTKSGAALLGTFAKGIDASADMPLLSVKKAIEPVKLELGSGSEKGTTAPVNSSAEKKGGVVFQAGSIVITIGGSENLGELEKKMTAIFSQAALQAGLQ